MILDTYFDKVGECSLLSREEEVELAKAIESGIPKMRIVRNARCVSKESL